MDLLMAILDAGSLSRTETLKEKKPYVQRGRKKRTSRPQIPISESQESWRHASKSRHTSVAQMKKPGSHDYSPIFSVPDKFHYSPLENKEPERAIRLIELKPNSEPNALIECEISHVKFSDMPKYEALSYAWGSEPNAKLISLNNKIFAVRENLCNALLCLRQSQEPRRLWIDAICINQHDLIEKTSQIRLMPYIYGRAKTVVVWLGLLDPLNEKSALLSAKYWKRVWIVQEIGKARRIRVHWNDKSMDWEDFVSSLRSSPIIFKRETESYEKSPVFKMAKQREEKYHDGYLLRNLLETHKHAKSSELRDKIYGFVGLASDCVGGIFPVDYRKSLVEIYKDVINFYRGSMIPDNILGFSKLIMQILGGPVKMVQDDPQIYLQQHFVANTTECQPGIDYIPTNCHRWGTISYVGPAYYNIASNPELIDTWTMPIRNLLGPQFSPIALQQSDEFLEELEDFYGPELESRLALYESRNNRAPIILVQSDPTAKDYDSSRPVQMGIAGSSAAVGDLVYQVPGRKFAFVLRSNGGGLMTDLVVGLAGVALPLETSSGSDSTKWKFRIPPVQATTERLLLGLSTYLVLHTE